MLYLEDINTEEQAMAVVPELEVEAIEATEAITNKRNKIIRTEANLKMVMKLCVVRKWQTPMKRLQVMLDRLGEAKAELQVNLWRS
jgi:hypothetical protein|tara:strand:- start:352 stop:609 length:258 start_codon:yes stop_codon:yes gene_type:complete